MGLQESYEGNDTRYQAYGARYACQTFTTGSAYTIDSVALYGYRDGDPTNVTVSLYAVDENHKPTGAALATVTETAANLAEGSGNVEWYTFTFDVPCALSDATEYAIVVYSSGTGSSVDYNWRYKIAGDYASGMFFYSIDSGASWTDSGGGDATFRIYGTAAASYADAEGTFAIALAFDGMAEAADIYQNAEGTFAIALALSGTGTKVSGTITGGPGTQTKRRLISIANNVLYYEDI